MKKASLILSVFLLAACTATKLLQPSQADVDRGAQKFPGYTLTDINQGKSLYESKCTACHGAKNPASKTEVKWREIVPKMAAKSLKNGKGEIDLKAQDLILKYLITMGSAPKTN